MLNHTGNSYVTRGYSYVTQDTVIIITVSYDLFGILNRSDSRFNDAAAKHSKERSGILK